MTKEIIAIFSNVGNKSESQKIKEYYHIDGNHVYTYAEGNIWKSKKQVAVFNNMLLLKLVRITTDFTPAGDMCQYLTLTRKGKQLIKDLKETK
tara:strand:+ start:873 stop:1151 length:279 start_codon:yes stop_codon:yes gene_type:complete